MAEPVVVYSKDGLGKMFPDWFTADQLEAINREIANKEQPLKYINTTNSLDQTFSGYAGYLRAITQIKQLLSRTVLEPAPFLKDTQHLTTIAGGRKRLQRVAWILSQLSTLRDEDRIEIAYKLASGDHVAADPELFIRLAAKQPFSSDLVPCSWAFVIGRSLYLLGKHQEALEYFSIAFYRHPYSSKYEMWYRIALLKLDKPVPPPISPPYQKPDLYLYYLTLQDMKDNKKDDARKRLEEALKKDSHNILANQLMEKYFNQPLEDTFFFKPSEGL
jgi:tetratricopeptide (TPR) repeat protein